jgi:NADH dehydrogenase/NADH:ubiquinone oxidoreductase subunit G
MALIKTVINGKEIKVERDTWALEAAQQMGVDIPTLCHHPAMEPYGACRLCVVEVTKGKWTWLTTSCDLPIREGLSIRTDTEAVKNARKMAIELIWARAPEADSIKELANSLGVEKPRFEMKSEAGKCILCGLCVRVCDKIIGASAISFVNRGKDRRVRTPFNEVSEACTGCNSCVAVCPTGHILTVDENKKRNMQTWRTELDMVTCEDCEKAYMPLKQYEDIQKKLGNKIILPKVCPSCLRSSTVSKLSKLPPCNI